jgi:hypothetical protein
VDLGDAPSRRGKNIVSATKGAGDDRYFSGGGVVGVELGGEDLTRGEKTGCVVVVAAAEAPSRGKKVASESTDGAGDDR